MLHHFRMCKTLTKYVPVFMTSGEHIKPIPLWKRHQAEPLSTVWKSFVCRSVYWGRHKWRGWTVNPILTRLLKFGALIWHKWMRTDLCIRHLKKLFFCMWHLSTTNYRDKLLKDPLCHAACTELCTWLILHYTNTDNRLVAACWLAHGILVNKSFNWPESHLVQSSFLAQEGQMC